ncbi:MAG: hypothetical protein II453_05945, partial [Alphaproteobacteria bacterium]|nr:hypothetical protein [Alphaproteobacteria bacterium]
IISGSNISAITGIKSNGSIGAYTSISNTSSGGAAIITDVSTDTGNASPSISGEFTFKGETVNITFDGSTATISHTQATTSAGIEPSGA